MSIEIIDTCATKLYAIMDENECLLTIKNKTLHLTHASAKEYRKLTKRKAFVVCADFTNYTNWQKK